MHQSTKIILHGLFNWHIVVMLFFMPWLLKKCYWVIWGGDLYVYQLGERNWKWRLREFFRRFVIKRIGHYVTFFDPEYHLAVKWYGAKGMHHKSFTYPSNIFKYTAPKKHNCRTVNIQVGNSATETNKHTEILVKLSNYKEEDIKIYAPLSYGDSEYAKNVAAHGLSIFNQKFVPMLDYMPHEQYVNYLASIDIAIFNHVRQQGVGNLITLLGMGKTVYMRKDVTSWAAMCNLGLHIFDVEELGIKMLTQEQTDENKKIISEIFSEATLVAQLHCIFRSDLRQVI